MENRNDQVRTFSVTSVLVPLLLIVSLVWRVFNNHYGVAPNFDLTTAACVTILLTRHADLASVMPFIVIVCGDMLLFGSFSLIFLFTWSGWLGVGCILRFGFSGLLNRRPIVSSLFCAFVTAIWFFLWTNFGVWLIGRGVYYPAGLSGLYQSYVNGLPFLRPMLLANVIFVPLFTLLLRYSHTHIHTIAIKNRIFIRGIKTTVSNNALAKEVG